MPTHWLPLYSSHNSSVIPPPLLQSHHRLLPTAERFNNLKLCGSGTSGTSNLLEAVDGNNKLFFSFEGEVFCSQKDEECYHQEVNNECRDSSALVAVVSKTTAKKYAMGPDVAKTPWWINRDLLAGRQTFINPEISRFDIKQQHSLSLNFEQLGVKYSKLQTTNCLLLEHICKCKELTEDDIDSLSVMSL